MVKTRGTIIHSNNGTTDGHIRNRRHFSAGSTFRIGAENSSFRAAGGDLTLMLVSLYRLANSFSALKFHGIRLSEEAHPVGPLERCLACEAVVSRADRWV